MMVLGPTIALASFKFSVCIKPIKSSSIVSLHFLFCIPLFYDYKIGFEIEFKNPIQDRAYSYNNKRKSKG